MTTHASRIILIGCGKQKADASCRADEMYIGSLFRKRLEYARRSGWPFYIVSAKYGLIPPQTLIAPYDLTVSDLEPLELSAWSLGVAQALLSQLSEPFDSSRFLVELHMGNEYAEPLRILLPAVGVNYDWPLRGLTQGQQMHWYTHNASALWLRSNPALRA
jgi:hypothetical protein